MFGCGVTVLQNMANLSKRFVVYFIGSPKVLTNRYTIAMAEKVNCNENNLRICIFNDCDNSGSES